MKIFKLFISLSLILSISLLNSFAAISVSDGSAFVTKAEFAADLNNLSNRMSSLENSLDAKIDSLVSSYLSRNGIWNGEKQTILDYTTLKVWNNIWANSSTGNETIENDPISFCKLSKSGLVNLKFQIEGRNALVTTTTGRGTLFQLTSNYTVVGSVAKAIISFRYDVLNKVESEYHVIFDKMFYTALFNSTTDKGKTMIGFLPSYSFNDFFFAEKDMDLYLRLVVISEGGNFSNDFFTKDIDKGKYINPRLKFDSVDVY